MEIRKTSIEGVLEITPRVFPDGRGYFYESWNQRTFANHGLDFTFLQDNQSKSQKHVLRGLHFQNPPHQQGKLVRVISGSALDVAVDIRKNSPTYGQHEKVVLSAEKCNMFWVPPGFAHGFLTLEDDTIFAYKCTNFYNKEAEQGMMWNDPDLGIDWGITDAQLSDKDKVYKPFREFESLF